MCSQMQPFSRYLRNGFVWAMLPLTLLAGRPYSGCICENGSFKVFCTGCASGLGTPIADTSEKPGRCGCCRGNESHAIKNDSEGKRDCSQPSRALAGKNVSAPATGKCGCKWVVQDPAVAPPHVLPRNAEVQPLVLVLPTDCVAALYPRAAVHAELLNTGPPTDLIVTLHRLVI